MNVPADALYALSQASGAPANSRAEGVVRWAAERLKAQHVRTTTLADVAELYAVCVATLDYLTNEANHDHGAAVRRLEAVLAKYENAVAGRTR